MKKYVWIIAIGVLISANATAQKNFCHLIYELSTTRADSLGEFKANIDQPCELCPFYLSSSVCSKYEGVRQCEFDFGRDRTYPEAPGKKFNIATATITLAAFNLPENEADMLQMFDRAVKYLHDACFNAQQISKVFTDSKTKVNPTRIVYLYDAGFTPPVADNNKDYYYYYFLNRPHMDVRLQPDPLRPFTNLQVVLVWATEAK